MDDVEIRTYWWAMMLRGIFAILFGVLAFFMPGLTLEVLVLWFGIYALVDGIFAILAAGRAASHHEHWWLLLLDGVMGLGAGIFTFAWPGNTALILVMIIGAWAFLTGLLEIGGAVTAPWPSTSRWLMGLSGVLSLVLGWIMMAHPLPAAISVIWIIGVYAIAFGLMQLFLGMRLKKLHPMAAT
jgi:uncharacterized membrane protein HdeD (DUF308 family)